MKGPGEMMHPRRRALGRNVRFRFLSQDGPLLLWQLNYGLTKEMWGRERKHPHDKSSDQHL